MKKIVLFFLLIFFIMGCNSSDNKNDVLDIIINNEEEFVTNNSIPWWMNLNLRTYKQKLSDGNFLVTVYECENGKIISTNDPVVNQQYEYDSNGWLLSISYFDDVKEVFEHDINGNIIRTYYESKDGNISNSKIMKYDNFKLIEELDENTNQILTKLKYNDYGQLELAILYDLGENESSTTYEFVNGNVLINSVECIICKNNSVSSKLKSEENYYFNSKFSRKKSNSDILEYTYNQDGSISNVFLVSKVNNNRILKYHYDYNEDKQLIKKYDYLTISNNRYNETLYEYQYKNDRISEVSYNDGNSLIKIIYTYLDDESIIYKDFYKNNSHLSTTEILIENDKIKKIDSGTISYEYNYSDNKLSSITTFENNNSFIDIFEYDNNNYDLNSLNGSYSYILNNSSTDITIGNSNFDGQGNFYLIKSHKENNAIEFEAKGIYFFSGNYLIFSYLQTKDYDEYSYQSEKNFTEPTDIIEWDNISYNSYALVIENNSNFISLQNIYEISIVGSEDEDTSLVIQLNKD